MEAWGLSDKGNVREQNQDYYLIERLPEDAMLAVVCDGMGGAKSGNVASRLACEVFTGEVKRSFQMGMKPKQTEAMLRSAAALGMDAVLLTSAGSDPLYRRAVRVSMGTVFQVPWTYLPQDADWTALLHEEGFVTAAMALRDDSVSIADARLAGIEKLAVVLGTEGDGLAADTIARCDYTVRIPMSHGVDSLNVAAASAVAFYQLGTLAK